MVTLMPNASVARPLFRAADGLPGGSIRKIGIGALLLLLLTTGSSAQSLRVTTWNLQPPAVRTNAAAVNAGDIHISAAAAELKKLNPDVILLQQVVDWAMCDALAQALKPAQYNVVACSAFREARTNALRKQQVAILAKPEARAYFSWTESWRNRGAPTVAGGFAFAAFQVGNQRIGFFSVQAGAPTGLTPSKKRAAAAPEERLTPAIEQVLSQVRAINNWITNRVQACVIGGTFGRTTGQVMALEGAPLQMLESAGFGDAFQGVPAAGRATQRAKAGQTGPVADYLFIQPPSCASDPVVQPVAAARHYPVACEVRLDLLKVVALPMAHVESAPPRKAPPAQRQASSARALSQSDESVPVLPPPGVRVPSLLWLAVAVAGLAILAVVFRLAFRRKRLPAPAEPALLPAGSEAPSGYTVVLTSQSASESALPGREPARAPRPLIHMEARETTHTQTELWRQRVQAAERRAERADAVIRAGLVPHLRRWLKQKLVRRLISDRTQMLETQEAAACKAQAVEQRLARIEQQIQQQERVYQERLAELTRELLAAKEENCELIRARIDQVKAEMATARARLVAQSHANREGVE